MPNLFVKVAGRMNRRKKRNEVAVVDRQNFLSRDDKLTLIGGTEKITTDTFTAKCTWSERYYTTETGAGTKKTLAYTQDGKIWLVNDISKKTTLIQSDFAKDAYPESWLIKLGDQTFLYVVDGTNLWKHDGNNAHIFKKVKVEDALGQPVNPIDNIEHRDRQFLISEDFVFVSENLNFDVFDSANDSVQLVVGSGKGKNLALGKIEDTLFIFNTEGIFALIGDVISAVASTFEIALVDSIKIIAGRTARLTENAINFLADDFNLWSWNGQTAKKLSHDEKLEDFVNNKRVFLDKAVAHYDSIRKYYMMSIVRPGQTTPDFEVFWDAIDQKIDFIKGRNVNAYMQTDSTIEENFIALARSDVNYLVYADRERSFDGSGIEWKSRTGDLMLNKRRNFRISNIYPEVVPEGELTMFVRYLLDGRLSDISVPAVPLVPTNNDMELWTGGLPDNWALSGAGAVMAEDNATKYNGNASAKVISGAGSTAVLTANLPTTAYNGRTVKFLAWVKCSTASKAKISVGDSSGFNTSGFHSGGGEWEQLEVIKKIDDDSTAIFFFLQVESGVIDAHFDSTYAEVQPTELANFDFNLSGDHLGLGFIKVTNQAQFSGRIKPRINYSKGQTVALEIYGRTTALDLVVYGFGLDIISKGEKKGRKVGA